MINYGVYGLGRVGACAVHDLLKHCEAAKVYVWDPAPEARTRLFERLESICTREELDSVVFGRPHTWIRDVDVVVNCAVHTAIMQITKECTDNGIPVCDLGGNPAVVRSQREMDPESPVVADCGISPGISNIIAADMARKGYTRIRVRCGGLPQGLDTEDQTGLNYKLVFSPEGLLSEYSGWAYAIYAGNILPVRALSGLEQFEDFEAAYTSNNSKEVVDYLAELGVRFYDYKTLRWPRHWDIVRGWRVLGYLCGDPEANAELAADLKHCEWLKYDPEDPQLQDMLILNVDARAGRRMEHRKIKRLEVRHNNITGFSAMEQTTAWGITIVAQALASGEFDYPEGFSTPEQWVPGDYLLDELSRRDY